MGNIAKEVSLVSDEKNYERGKCSIGTSIIVWTNRICDNGKIYKCSTWSHTWLHHWFDGK